MFLHLVNYIPVLLCNFFPHGFGFVINYTCISFLMQGDLFIALNWYLVAQAAAVLMLCQVTTSIMRINYSHL